MKSVRRIIAILLAMVMVFGLAACGTPTNNGGGNEGNNNNATPVDPNAPQYGGDFVIARSTAPRGLFGLTASIRADYVNPAIESLCRRNPYTEEIEPLLAKSWEVDNEAHTVIFLSSDGFYSLTFLPIYFSASTCAGSKLPWQSTKISTVITAPTALFLRI